MRSRPAGAGECGGSRGRPCLYVLAAGGEAGVGWVFDNFTAGPDLTLALAGCTARGQLRPQSLRRHDGGG